jgi:hypothetical protein
MYGLLEQVKQAIGFAENVTTTIASGYEKADQDVATSYGYGASGTTPSAPGMTASAPSGATSPASAPGTTTPSAPSPVLPLRPPLPRDVRLPSPQGD